MPMEYGGKVKSWARTYLNWQADALVDDREIFPCLVAAASAGFTMLLFRISP